MCAGNVLVSCDVSDKWRVEGIAGWTGGRVGACVCEVHKDRIRIVYAIMM